MKAPLILGLTLATLVASTAFAVDGSSRIINQLHQNTSSVGLRVTDNGSKRTISRLHKDTIKAETRPVDSDSEQTTDRLHHSISRLDLRIA